MPRRTTRPFKQILRERLLFIVRAKGEDRRFIHSLGVAATFSGEYVSPELFPYKGLMLVGGYLKLGAWNDEVLVKLMRCARQRQCTVVLNVCIAQESGVSESILCKFVSGQTGLSLKKAGQLLDFFGFRLRRVRMPKLKPLKRGGSRAVKADKEGSEQ